MEQQQATEEENEGRGRPGVTVPPYIPFGTLMNLLRRMKQEGAPDVVDRSYLSGMSGGYQAQVIAAMKAFNLIEEDGRPSRELELFLRADEDDWPAHLRQQAAWLYAAPLEFADRNATQGQLEKVFREEFGLTGSTLRKAIKFYLDMSQYVDLPVSPFWRAPPRPPRGESASQGPNTRRRTRVPATRRRPRERAETPEGLSTGQRTQTIELSSGGNVTLGVAVDLFTLSEADRKFVFELVDRVRSYGRERDGKE